MFIRTLRPITKGEKLVFSYSNKYDDYKDRSRYLKTIGIDCQCRLCRLESSESQEIKFRRAQLLKTYKKSIKPKSQSTQYQKSLNQLLKLI